jgi:3-hydroxyacyl-CoA dehydrogenase/enoyl-CoA hydratase/3-hydroxybutyryl-CoA epimerase
LELALASTYRVATSRPETRMGLPEIKLGIHPGWGGTVRLPQLIGPVVALQAMLRGTLFTAKQAKANQLVDFVVPSHQVTVVAKALLCGQLIVKRRAWHYWFGKQWWARQLLCAVLRRELKKKNIWQHYPAAAALVNLWQRSGGQKHAMNHEALSIARCLVTDVSRQLVRLFFLQERIKSRVPRRINFQHVHVIGAGVMGGDIALCCARHGLRVTIHDESVAALAKLHQRARSVLSLEGVAIRDQVKILDRLVIDGDHLGCEQADVVIEAIVEQAEVKKAMFKAIEPRMKPNALLATNTSSIPLESLADVLVRPQRLVGIHFFNPVFKMRLVEVVRTNDSHQDDLDGAAALVMMLKKIPIQVRSAPGFCVNRILMPYLLSAMKCIQEGISADCIDAEMRHFGMPMGPLELADVVGLDVCLLVAKELSDVVQESIPTVLERLVSEQKLGKKSGAGFHRYGAMRSKASCQRSHTADAELRDRLLLPLLQACLHCWQTQVVASADELDMAMVLGAGFAPFRGGPMRYMRDQGEDHWRKRIGRLVTAGHFECNEQLWREWFLRGQNQH